ncbi:MAG: LysM peptidoglycan-binding domain-containing protein [Pedobacter sp.]|nr:LysM peptidoglycan-binding domain-containing protein [Pedobacter sp.]MDQ8051498.1 LysM peptidoglycan-binding domain-containing protein [Pedobacter sp.]
MHKPFILVIAALLLTIGTSFANSRLDSIGVENNNGKKLIVHKVEAKETYYAIGRRYNVNYKDVILFNDNKPLHVGVIIKVPTAIPFISEPSAAATAGTFDYSIKAKDNLNMLAERYGTTVNEIKRINGLNSINLQIGQVLKIPVGTNSAQTPAVEQPVPTKTVVDPKTTISSDGQYITHTVKAKEHLNLLAEKYGTTVDEIKKLNNLRSNNLQIGQLLKIPATADTPAESPVPEPVAPKNPLKTEPPVSTPVGSQIADGSFEHVVAPGETIYSIAKKYNMTTFQLKTAANFTGNDVTVGQKLIIKGPKSVAVADGEEGTSNGNTIKDPALRGSPSSYGLVQMEEKGTAVWIADPDLDPTKMLVLHRTAAVGTIIKVTNPMSNRSAFAKVVGKFTENESTKDVIIVMTKAVADAVGALDKRFFCNLTYGAQENEQ